MLCNTDSPIHIHKIIPTEVWKAFNVGINAWNITAVLHSKTQSDEFHLFDGDFSTYTLWCKRCGQRVTLHGSIGETLFHAPTAMLYHWNMIEPHDEHIHRESMLIPLLFTSCENYVGSSKSFQEGWNWMEGLNICQKPTKYEQSMFLCGC